jgi:copper chaperone CopZ
MKKMFLLSILLLCTNVLFGKVNYVQIGINGLTCSMCSRSVEIALEKLDFIDKVEMDLEKTQAAITFKSGDNINFAKIAKAVKDAGFSVRFLKAYFDQFPQLSDGAFQLGNNTIKLINQPNDKSTTEIPLTFVGYNFMDKKTLKIWQSKYTNFRPFSKKENEYFVGIE